MVDYIVYDCEIVKCIPQKGVHFDGFDYCKGWDDHGNMGISVIGFYRSDRNAYYHWQSDLMFDSVAGEDWRINYMPESFKIIGFNSHNFDDRLMAANGQAIQTDYDLLEKIRIAAGFTADYQSVPKEFSYSLDAIAKANGMAKTGNGALAPQLWQQGECQSVIDYCLHDVKITRELLELGLAGELIDPNTGDCLQLAPIGE